MPPSAPLFLVQPRERPTHVFLQFNSTLDDIHVRCFKTVRSTAGHLFRHLHWRAVPNHSRTCSGLASPSKDRCSTSTIAPPNRASSIARSSTACRSAQDAVMLGSGINAKDRGIGLGLVPSFERQPKRLPFQEAASNEGSRTRSAPAPITREQCRNASF